MFDKEGFSERLRSSREALRLRQDEVASQLGIGRTAYAAYESGKNLPPLEAIMTLLDILNVTFEWLTKGEGEQRPQTVAEAPAAAREIEQKYIKALETLVSQQEEIINLKEQLLQKEKTEKKKEAEKSEKL